MRPEMKEYHLDWMLYSTMATAASCTNSTPKEFKHMLPYMPYVNQVLEAVISQGEVGRKFLNLVTQYFENIITAHDRGKHVAMSTFCFSPALLYAMDVAPISMELVSALAALLWKRGTFDYLDHCVELGFTETSCSSQRGSMGAYLAGLGQDIDFIVIDTAGVCDTNSNAFSFYSSYMDVPMYNLNFPATVVDQRTISYQRQDYRELIRFIEQRTGEKLDLDKLNQTLKEIEKQDEYIAQLEDMQRMVPNPLPIVYNLFAYAGRFLAAGLPVYTDLLKEMVAAARQKAKQGRSGLNSGHEKCRAFFFYIDHYSLNLNLWMWLDRHGISHMGNILSRHFSEKNYYTSGREQEAYKIDTKDLDSMIDSLADLNSKLPMVRTVRGPYDAPHMWLEDTLSLAKMISADCMIYNGTPGCRNTWANVKLISRDLEKYGYPTHVMYGDAFDDRVESWDTTSQRLEEFFEVRRLLN